MSGDWISTITSGLAWLVILAELGVAVAALARLRVTASGILLGLGFGALAMSNLFNKLVWTFYFRPALADGEYMEIETSMQALSLLTSAAAMLFWILIGIGAVLIPSALKPR